MVLSEYFRGEDDRCAEAKGRVPLLSNRENDTITAGPDSISPCDLV